MKVKKIIINSIILGLGFCSTAFAGNYYAPERITCGLDSLNKTQCYDFNHSYFVEHITTAALSSSESKVFLFATGTAYELTKNEWVILYAYQNSSHETIILKNVNSTIKPDLVNGIWKKHKHYFMCDSGYMACSIIT